MSSAIAIACLLRFADLTHDPNSAMALSYAQRRKNGEQFLSARALPRFGSHSCQPCHALFAAPLFDTCHG